jgi:hypothetical protein
MRDDEYEPNRFLGFPVRTGPQAGKDEKPQAGNDAEPRARAEEPQHVMGFPVNSFSDREWLGALAHPVRDYRRWRRRRAPSGTGEDEPSGGH